MSTKRTVAWLTLAVLTLGGSQAQAGLLASENFNYAAGSTLLGQNGGSGFSGAWVAGGFNSGISSNYLVNGASVPYDGLATGGGSVSTSATNVIAGITRALSTQLGAAGTTDYVSVVLRPDGALSGGTLNNYFGLYLASSLGNDVFFGKTGGGSVGDYVVESRGGALQHDSGVAAVTGQSVLLVLRADFTSGIVIDKFTLYVNPTVGGAEPATGTVKQDTDIGNVTGLTIYSTGAFSIDEIRVGTTFADVVPAAVPEPSSLAMVVLGGLGLAGASLAAHRAKTSTRPA
jgi:hypothetical protein